MSIRVEGCAEAGGRSLHHQTMWNAIIMSGLFAYAVSNLLDKLKVADVQPGFWKQQKRW
jgi:hypothetical protein